MSVYYGPRISHEIIDEHTVQIFANGLPLVTLRESTPDLDGYTTWLMPFPSMTNPDRIEGASSWKILDEIIRDDAQALSQLAFSVRYPAYVPLALVPVLDQDDIDTDADWTAARLLWGGQHVGTIVLDERDNLFMVLDLDAAPVTDADYTHFGSVYAETGLILDLLVPRGEQDRRAHPVAA